MGFKDEINKRGLKIKWVAKEIGCNYASLRVYLNNPNIMPIYWANKLNTLFK